MGMDSQKYGGLERFNIELLKYAKFKGDNILFIYETTPENLEFISDIQLNGGKLLILNCKNNSKIKYIISLYKIIKRENIDILHAHFPPARFIAIPFLYYFTNVKLFQTIHSAIKTIKFKTKYFYKYFLVNNSITITVSEDIKRDCIRIFNLNQNNVITSYLGVHENNLNREKARTLFNFTSSDLIIATIGTFNFRKGFDVLVKAASILKESNIINSNIKFIIIGQTEYEKLELKKIIDKLNLTSYFMLLGIRSDIPFILKAVDIYCQPSRSEGTPLSIMEALAAGLPIVASNVDGIPEAIKDSYNGLLVKPDSADELSIAIKTLIKKPEIRYKLAANSKEMFKKFNVLQSVKDLHSIYNNELLNNKSKNYK